MTIMKLENVTKSLHKISMDNEKKRKTNIAVTPSVLENVFLSFQEIKTKYTANNIEKQTTKKNLEKLFVCLFQERS